MRRLASFRDGDRGVGPGALGCGKKDSTEDPAVGGGGGGSCTGGTGGGGGGSSSMEGHVLLIVGMEVNGKAKTEAEVAKEPEAERTS